MRLFSYVFVAIFFALFHWATKQTIAPTVFLACMLFAMLCGIELYTARAEGRGNTLTQF